MDMKRVSTIHPGRVLLEELLAPQGISLYHLVRDVSFPAQRIFEIVQGRDPSVLISLIAWRTTSGCLNVSG
jgi:plasmid maintenance system antidote protein VapI